jgi:hypothetical protein
MQTLWVHPATPAETSSVTMNQDVRARETQSTGTAHTPWPPDFCRIFAEDMTSLYLLSFLLTANHEQAERCFIAGIEDCIGESRVFKDCARSWARRTIVLNAIRLIAPFRDPTSVGSSPVPSINFSAAPANDGLPSAIFQLNAPDRFVFVMSVLERTRIMSVPFFWAVRDRKLLQDGPKRCCVSQMRIQHIPAV